MSFRSRGARASLLLLSCFGLCLGSALAQEPAPQTAPSSASAAEAKAAPAAQATALEIGAAPSPAKSPVESPANLSAEVVAPISPPAAIESSPCCTLPDGTVIQLEIAEALNSKTAQRGQRFKLRLSAPLQTADGVLVAAGAEGEGEVIHADRARGGGKAGELILAARFINGPDGEIKLRGMKLGGIGKDQRDSANALLIGTTVAAPILAPVAMLVRGGNLEIPAGMPAQAKLAGSIRLLPLPAAATPNTETVGTAHATDTGADTPSTSPSATPH
jgi:hypothetical protein